MSGYMPIRDEGGGMAAIKFKRYVITNGALLLSLQYSGQVIISKILSEREAPYIRPETHACLLPVAV